MKFFADSPVTLAMQAMFILGLGLGTALEAFRNNNVINIFMDVGIIAFILWTFAPHVAKIRDGDGEI